MRSTTSTYYIEVKEGEIAKRVPHTKGKRHTEFHFRKAAVIFLKGMIENNPRHSFRLCKCTETHFSGKWFSKKK